MEETTKSTKGVSEICMGEMCLQISDLHSPIADL
jgi:hypothetical protein